MGKGRELYGLGVSPNNSLVISFQVVVVATVLGERTHKSVVLVSYGRGHKDGKEVVIDVLANNIMPTANKDGMATLSMVGITWSGVVSP